MLKLVMLALSARPFSYTARKYTTIDTWTNYKQIKRRTAMQKDWKTDLDLRVESSAIEVRKRGR
jgi:hypothetical protein